jgi:hypothetical protein
MCDYIYIYMYIFTAANLLGFNLWGRGLVDTKMHAPKKRKSPGTLLEPFSVGKLYIYICNVYLLACLHMVCTYVCTKVNR